MPTSEITLDYPAIGIVEGGLTHAARPGETHHGWRRAMCNSRLYVSIEHHVLPFDEGDRFTFRTVPLRATSDPAPTVTDQGVVAEGVDCRHCARALAAYEGEQRAAEAAKVTLAIEERITLLLSDALRGMASAASHELAARFDLDEQQVAAVLADMYRRKLINTLSYVREEGRPVYALTSKGFVCARALIARTDAQEG